MNCTQSLDLVSSLDIASLVVTFLTGAALAVFAWRSYSLSRSIAQGRYSPVLELYPAGPPETGSFQQNVSKFQGVRWQLSLVNSGDVPIWCDNLTISIQITLLPEASEQEVWADISKFCEFYDEEGNPLTERAIGVDGYSHRKVTVYICREGQELHRLVGVGHPTQMQFELHQRGKHGRPEVWVREKSGSFRLPEKFDKNPILIG
ncbi:MAG: hypothetical protein ACLFPU_04905 [Dehalococcoidia bacterium]